MCPFGTHHFQQNDLFGIWVLQCFRPQIVKKQKTISKSSWRPPIVSSVQAAPTLVQVLKKWETEKPVVFFTHKISAEKNVSQKKTQGIYLFFFGYAAYVPSPLMYCHIYTYVFFTISFHCVQWHLGMFPMFFQGPSCNVLGCGGVGTFWNQSYS